MRGGGAESQPAWYGQPTIERYVSVRGRLDQYLHYSWLIWPTEYVRGEGASARPAAEDVAVELRVPLDETYPGGRTYIDHRFGGQEVVITGVLEPGGAEGGLPAFRCIASLCRGDDCASPFDDEQRRRREAGW